MNKYNRVFAIIIALVSLSCGEEEKKEQIRLGEAEPIVQEESPESASSQVYEKTMSEDGVVQITLTANDQMQFSTKEITVQEGQKIRLTLKHVGELPESAMGHNFVLLEPGTDIGDFAQKASTSGENYIPEGGEQVIAHTEMIGGGEEVTIEFEAPAPGTYDFMCSFPGHWILMQGKFIVEASGASN